MSYLDDESETILGDITHGPFANPLLSAIYKKFGRLAFARSAACCEFEAFLRRIKAGGKSCLEIGSYNGITAIVLSQFFDHVIGVTVDEVPPRMFRREILDHLGIQNVEFIDAKDNEEKAQIVKRLSFDFAYMDGDHTNDTRTDFELVKHCGRVLFHEYWPLQAPVWNLVESLPQAEIQRAEYDCFAYWERRDG